MTVLYAVVEHDPYTPKDGYSETIGLICSTKELAEQQAKQLNIMYAPYYYTISPIQVYEGE